MLRSNVNNSEKSDFTKIKTPKHINEVWESIEGNIPTYFNKIIEEADEFAQLKANPMFKVQSSTPDIRRRISKIFENGFILFQKEEYKYSKFFSKESMCEFEDEDDPKAFKSALSTKVPVILKARNSKRPTMREWQEKFAISKAADVYAIFFNLIDFMEDYVNETDATEFGNYNDVADLEKLFALNEDDDYNVPGVIGMGIKSTALFYLNPKYFLVANKNTLYGFHFLSDCQDFGLPSGTNEFIMINDFKEESNRRHNINMLIDQNYWYPYDLFMLYSLRTYRIIKDLCAKYNYILDDSNKFVHLNAFMSEIWRLKRDTINTMTGGDQDDAR